MESSGRVMISFLTTQRIRVTWERLKCEMSVDDSQLAALLIRCYEDYRSQPVCPSCNSNLEQFCSSCCTTIDCKKQNHHSSQTSATNCHEEGELHKDTDSIRIEQKNFENISEPFKEDNTVRNIVIDKNNENEICETKETELRDVEEIQAADESEESEVEMGRENDLFEKEQEGELREIQENSVAGSTSEMKTEESSHNEDEKKKETVTSQFSVSANSESVFQQHSRSSDIVACLWCNVSFKSVVALSKHLIEHTSVAWQQQHFKGITSNTMRNQKSKTHNKTDNANQIQWSVRHSRCTRFKTLAETKSLTPAADANIENETGSTSQQKIFRCMKCGVAWKTPVGLTFHLQRKHIKRNAYKCLKCEMTFKSLRSMAFHMQKHPVKSVRERDAASHPHQCGICGIRFVFVGNLANHMEKHTEPSSFWCSQCQSGFLSMTELTGHQCHVTHGKVAYVGNGASQSVLKASQGQQNSVDLSSSSVSTDLPAKSGKQGTEEISVIQTVIEQNISEHSERGRKRKKSQLKEVERPYKCPDCPASFVYSSNLKLHSQKHSGQNAFPCSQCEQSFTSKSRLFTHQEKDHWGSIPITCQDCGKVFGKVRNLEEHRVLHTGERPYACNICGESFQYRQALTRHRRSHRASYFKCKQCGAEFHLNSAFKAHMNDHNAVKPHLCSTCGQAFSSPYLLKQHAVTHGQKQFVCEYCGKAFHKKGQHKMHMRTHLTVKPFPCPHCDKSFVSRSKLKLHVTLAHLGLKPHKCNQCEAAFGSATILKDHIAFVHTNERPFECPMCGSRFASKRHLNLHLKRTHKNSNIPVTSEQPNTVDVKDSSCTVRVSYHSSIE